MPQLCWTMLYALRQPNCVSSGCMLSATLLAMIVWHRMKCSTFQKVRRDLVEDPTKGGRGMSSQRISNSWDSQNHQEKKLSCGHKIEMTGEGSVVH